MRDVERLGLLGQGEEEEKKRIDEVSRHYPPKGHDLFELLQTTAHDAEKWAKWVGILVNSPGEKMSEDQRDIVARIAGKFQNVAENLGRFLDKDFLKDVK